MNEIPQANMASARATGTLGWINSNPDVVNINSVETLSIGLEVLFNPSVEGKRDARAIWETRKANAEVFCQASPESAYTALMEAVIYGEGVPVGLEQNRAFVEKVFGVNVYARIAKAENRPMVFDNPVEYQQMLAMRESAATSLDPAILGYTDVMLKELEVALLTNNFANIPAKEAKVEFTIPQQNVAAVRAKQVYDWIEANPQVQNINSVETLSIGLDVLQSPSVDGRIYARKIWEKRRANAEVFCQASPESAYTALMDAVIYSDEAPYGLIENRAAVEKIFGVNVYARIAKAENRPMVFDNPAEYQQMAQMRETAAPTLDPEILGYTDTMMRELQVALLENRFENIPAKQNQM